jgi:hypothetical protein
VIFSKAKGAAMNRTGSLVALAVVCAAGVGAQSAEAAKHRTYYSEFDVTVQGQMVESWTKNWNHPYACSPRTESSGGATIEFATRKKYRVTADPYTGFHGRPLVDVTVDRHGQSREVNLDGTPAPCGEVTPDLDGSACGQRTFLSRLALPKTSRFGFDLRGDRHEYGPDCPYPPATPALAEDFYESTSAIGLNPSKVNWHDKLFGGCDAKGRCHKGRKRVTMHHVQHFVSPYGKAEWGEDVTGDYVADIDWTVKITRVGKLHTGR